MKLSDSKYMNTAAAGIVVAVILLAIYSGLIYKNPNVLYQISKKNLSVYRVAQTTRQLSKGDSAQEVENHHKDPHTPAPNKESIQTKKSLIGQNLITGNLIGKVFPCPKTIGTEFTCQYYRPAWKNRTDIKNVLEERMTRIKERCRAYYPYMFNTSLSKYGNNTNVSWKRGLLQNNKLKLGYCTMPKMGSTFWQKAWGPLKTAFEAQREADTPLNSTSKVNMKGHEEQLNFTVSRSPWQRMVSVYREKCEGRTGCKLGFGKNCTSSFTRFVECYTEMSSKEESEYYGHLDFTYKRCFLCDTPYIYSYVMSFENMAKESEFIFQEAGLRDPVSVMNKVRAESIRDVEKENKKISYVDFWKQVPSELIDKVRFYYRYEIFLFDYPETPFYIDPAEQLV